MVVDSQNSLHVLIRDRPFEDLVSSLYPLFQKIYHAAPKPFFLAIYTKLQSINPSLTTEMHTIQSSIGDNSIHSLRLDDSPTSDDGLIQNHLQPIVWKVAQPCEVQHAGHCHEQNQTTVASSVTRNGNYILKQKENWNSANIQNPNSLVHENDSSDKVQILVTESDVLELPSVSLTEKNEMEQMLHLFMTSSRNISQKTIESLQNKTDEETSPDSIICEIKNHFKSLGIFHGFCTKVKAYG